MNDTPHEWPGAPELDPAAARAADLKLIDALLEQYYDDEAPHREIRVSQVMNAIAADERAAAPLVETTRRLRFPRVDRARWVAAAVLTAMCLVWVTIPANAPALAALNSAIAASDEVRDLQYRVLVDRGERSGEATLHAGGGRRFVLSHPSPDGERLFGSDGEIVWYIPADAAEPVSVNSDAEAVERWRSRANVSIPFDNIKSALVELAQRFDLQVLEEATSEDGTAMTRLRGRRRDQGRPGPALVDVWCESESGLVHSLTLRWDPRRSWHRRGHRDKDRAARRGGDRESPRDRSRRERGRAGDRGDRGPRGWGPPRQITFELVGERDLPDAFYHHTYHHESERPVTSESGLGGIGRGSRTPPSHPRRRNPDHDQPSDRGPSRPDQRGPGHDGAGGGPGR